jgi:hypothetical protein
MNKHMHLWYTLLPKEISDKVDCAAVLQLDVLLVMMTLQMCQVPCIMGLALPIGCSAI